MARDPRTEQYLAQQHVDYQYVPAVPLSDFDLSAGLRNQARLTGPLNKEAVEEYALAMIDGVEFPAVISYKTNGKDIPISGNHRLHAAVQAERKTFDTYRVQTHDPLILERLTRSVNSIEGMRPSRKESIAQAVYLVENRRMTATAAASEFHIPVENVHRAIRTSHTKRRLATLGYNPDGLAATHLDALNAIKSDRVLRPVSEVISQARLASEVAQALIVEVRSQPNEDAQLRIVSQWRNREDIKDRIAKYKGGTVKRPMRGADNATRLLGLFGQLANVVAGAKNLSDLAITSPKEQERVRQAWLEAKAVVQVVLRG